MYIVQGLRRDGDSLRNVQERALRSVCYADVDLKAPPESLFVRVDGEDTTFSNQNGEHAVIKRLEA